MKDLLLHLLEQSSEGEGDEEAKERKQIMKVISSLKDNDFYNKETRKDFIKLVTHLALSTDKEARKVVKKISDFMSEYEITEAIKMSHKKHSLLFEQENDGVIASEELEATKDQIVGDINDPSVTSVEVDPMKESILFEADGDDDEDEAEGAADTDEEEDKDEKKESRKRSVKEAEGDDKDDDEDEEEDEDEEKEKKEESYKLPKVAKYRKLFSEYNYGKLKEEDLTILDQQYDNIDASLMQMDDEVEALANDVEDVSVAAQADDDNKV